MQSLCCGCWSCPLTHGRCSHSHDSRFHDSRCHVIRSHCRWSHCSSSPRPPRGTAENVWSCAYCAVRGRGLDRCCHCPQKAGQGWVPAHSCPSNASAPWGCTPRLRLRWNWSKSMPCTRRLHPDLPELARYRAWNLNRLTSGMCFRLGGQWQLSHYHKDDN